MRFITSIFIHMVKLFYTLSFISIMSIPTKAQPTWKSDTETIESTCLSLMRCISVNKGDTVNWARFNNLFLPTARFNFFALKGKELVLVNKSLEEFKKDATYGKVKFQEVELFKRINRFGKVAQVFQGYKFTVNDGELIRSGVNCIQLVENEGRWWIANISWQPETEDLKVPVE